MSTNVVSELATPAEAAIELRCSVHSVKRWLKEGQLAGVRTPGGHWRVLTSDMQRLQTHRRHSDRSADLRGAV